MIAEAITGEARQPRGPLWLRILLILVAAQAVFWLMSLFGEQSVRPDDMPSRPWVEYRLLDEAGKIDAESGVQRAYFKNNPIYRAAIGNGSPRAVFRIPFDRGDGQAELAFYLAGTPGLQEIRLNGSVVQPNVPFDTRRGAADGGSVYYILPPNLLKPAGNEIEVYVETQSSVLPLAAFSFTSPENAARATSWSNLFGSTLAVVTSSFLFFALLLCAIVNWPPPDRKRIRALMVLMAIWMVRTYFITFQTPFEIPFLITYSLYYMLETSAMMSIARYTAIDADLSRRWMRGIAAAWVVLLVFCILTPLYGFFVGPTAQGTMAYLPISLGVISAAVLVAVLVQLAASIARQKDGRWIEKLAIMLCLTALFVDMVDSAFALSIPFFPDLPMTFYKAVPFGLLLGLGIVTSIAREATEARRTVVESNAILAARLEEQDAELARSYEAQKQMRERQVMLEERQRIVRDMHDGIGGQLLGLMMQVKRGDTDLPTVEQGLQSSIADLRLIVDSMDTAEAGLAESLRAFDHRVRPQVEAAGMVFVFDLDLADDEPGPGPRPTLHILRVLQEAVSNAMRHSGCTTIRMTCGYRDAGIIAITVQDDGRGLPAAIQGGRGLANMRHRIATIGGSLKIESANPGTRVQLELPRNNQA